MILTDREIQIALARKQIIIDPLPQAIAYSSTSVDLTLDPSLTIFATGTSSIKKVIDPTAADYDIDEVFAEITRVETIDAGRGYELPVRHLVLGWTAEYVELPIDSRIAARVEGKSSLARLGLGVHINYVNHSCRFSGTD